MESFGLALQADQTCIFPIDSCKSASTFCFDYLLCYDYDVTAGTFRTSCNSWITDRAVVVVHLAVVGREGISGSRCGSTERVYQGYYNGLTPKPTNRLISIGLDINAQEFLDARRTRDTLPPALSMGEEHYTAVLKNYPKDFCTALAALAAEWNSRYVHMFYWRIQKRRGVQWICQVPGVPTQFRCPTRCGFPSLHCI